MKRSRHLYHRHQTQIHTTAAVIVAAILIILSLIPDPAHIIISPDLCQTIATTAGIMTGFTILATMLLPNLWQHPSLALLAQHPARSRDVLAILTRATWTLGTTTLTALAALAISPNSGIPHHIAAAVVILTTSLSTARLAEAIWMTQQIAAVIVTAQNRNAEQDALAANPDITPARDP